MRIDGFFSTVKTTRRIARDQSQTTDVANSPAVSSMKSKSPTATLIEGASPRSRFVTNPFKLFKHTQGKEGGVKHPSNRRVKGFPSSDRSPIGKGKHLPMDSLRVRKANYPYGKSPGFPGNKFSLQTIRRVLRSDDGTLSVNSSVSSGFMSRYLATSFHERRYWEAPEWLGQEYTLSQYEEKGSWIINPKDFVCSISKCPFHHPHQHPHPDESRESAASEGAPYWKHRLLFDFMKRSIRRRKGVFFHLSPSMGSVGASSEFGSHKTFVRPSLADVWNGDRREQGEKRVQGFNSVLYYKVTRKFV